MIGIKEQQRSVIFAPLFNKALEQAKSDSTDSARIDERIAFCLQLFSEKSSIPAYPHEIASLYLDFAIKMGCFTVIIDDISPWEIKNWDALENFAHDLIKEDVERGIKCIELSTLYQVRYWTQSSDRFHGTDFEKDLYVSALTSLLKKLHMLNINFEQFDNWDLDEYVVV